jgi:hypothetical protein
MMPVKKRQPRYCFRDAKPSCGYGSHSNLDGHESDDFAEKVISVLADQDTTASIDDEVRLIDFISHAVRGRRAVIYQWSKNRKTDDIIGLIQMARDSGDLDEAIWRCFLAAHFGRASATADQVQSAARFLCAFGTQPCWTWQRFCDAPDHLRVWLANNANDLQSLSFGNHRKYESQRPANIWAVMKSFLTLADKWDGPQKLVTVDEDEGAASDRFEMLYRRLTPLWHFGRTGRFDFLALMIDLRIISAEPALCYLRGATGPLKGAKRLWGRNRTINQLEQLAADLAKRLGLSPMEIEDALCNWQK